MTQNNTVYTKNCTRIYIFFQCRILRMWQIFSLIYNFTFYQFLNLCALTFFNWREIVLLLYNNELNWLWLTKFEKLCGLVVLITNKNGKCGRKYYPAIHLLGKPVVNLKQNGWREGRFELAMLLVQYRHNITENTSLTYNEIKLKQVNS